MIDRSAMMVRACGSSVLALTTYLLFRWARAEFRSADMTLAEAQRPFVVLVLFGLGSAATIAPAREGDMLLDPEYGTPINSVYAVAALTGLALHGGGGGADVQMERLERLNLLRPSLKVFRDKVRTLLSRPLSCTGTLTSGLSISILAEGQRKFIEVVLDSCRIASNWQHRGRSST